MLIVRSFDYRHLPQDLFDGKVGDANVRLYNDKGRLDFLELVYPDALETLSTVAHLDNVDSSARIEGLYADRHRLIELLSGDACRDETELQIAGYSKALKLIDEGAGELPLSADTVMLLHDVMYGYRREGDAHAPAQAPAALISACESLADSFDAKRCSPLILAAVFTVDLLCISPFDEGNGRIARLFADLMLVKAGFNIVRYESVERAISAAPSDYFAALNASAEKWECGGNDYVPYALLWMQAVHGAYEALFDKVRIIVGSSINKTQRIKLYVECVGGIVTKRQIRTVFPDISEATVENALGAMVRDREIEKVGAGRTTAYRWLGQTR